jgi:hypothetical protein
MRFDYTIMQQNSALPAPILVNLLKKWVKIGLASIKNPEAKARDFSKLCFSNYLESSTRCSMLPVAV